MTDIRIGPYVLMVAFDCYGDIEEVLDSRTGDDVQHLFSRETLALIESTARCAEIAERSQSIADSRIAEMEES